jgi:hypothetical protein
MKKILRILFISALFIVNAPGGNPVISVEGARQANFGNYPAKEEREFVFEIKNSGADVLKIIGVNKTCGACAEIKVSEREIAPGKTAELKLLLVPGALSGPYTKNFFVETNDPKQRFIMFTFSGNAVPVAEIRPSNLIYLGKITAGTLCRREFLIAPVGEGTLFGEPAAECNYPVEVSSSRGEKGLGIVFDFTPEKDIGQVKCEIKIPVLKPEGWPPLEILISAAVMDKSAPAPSNKKENGAPEKESIHAVIEYFYQIGCSECRRLDAFIIPQIKEDFSGRVRIERYDTALMESFLRFAFYRDRLNIPGNEAVCMIVNGKHAFNGYKNIEAGLLKQIGDSLRTNEKPEIFVNTETSQGKKEMLKKYAGNFTIAAIIAAGLLDGINPCVFSTLVFFISLLSVSKISGRKLILVGVFYCVSCFFTYLLLGLGILEFLKFFHGNSLFRNILNWAMFGILIIFAVFSFRDAWFFRKTGAASSVLLQVPDLFKKGIHEIMRRGLAYRFLIPGTLFIGFVVTIIESVCTGQVYVPTLALLVKTGGGGSAGWLFYLVLYNLMFILPLLAIFAVSYCGATTNILLRWTKHDVVIGKTAMGVFFLVLGILILLL